MALVVVVLAVLLVAANAVAAGPVVGLGDQNASTLTDSRFTSLGISEVRLIVPWDGAYSDRVTIGGWLFAAASSGLHPMVAFEHARGDACPDSPCALPSVEDYARAVHEFHTSWPAVDTFEAWNEANHVTQPTARGPGHAAGYYDALTAECPTCTIVGADLLGGENVASWLATFDRTVTTPVKVWGLHNYADANYGTAQDTDELLGLTTGEVWITETGGIVELQRPNNPWTYSVQRAAQATRTAFAIADSRATRITRMYLYNWVAGRPMDVGLTNPDGTLRPSYAVLAARLQPDAPTPAPADGTGTGTGTGRRLGAAAHGVDGAQPTSASARGPLGLAAARMLSRRVRARPRGAVRLSIACPRSGPRCQGRVTAGRWLTGATGYALATGARGHTHLRLTQAARRRLRKTGLLHVGVVVSNIRYSVVVTGPHRGP